MTLSCLLCLFSWLPLGAIPVAVPDGGAAAPSRAVATAAVGASPAPTLEPSMSVLEPSAMARHGIDSQAATTLQKSSGESKSSIAQKPAPAPTPPAADAPAVDLAAARRDVLALEAKGDLIGAKRGWNALAAKLAAGDDRDACLANVRMLAARMHLRAEIISARALDEHIFAEIGIDDADELRIVSAGKTVAWIDVPIDTLERAAAAARVSRAAAGGVQFEALSRGSMPQRRQALIDLGKQLARGEIDRADAFAAVARARLEPVPKGGYTFDETKGEWSGAGGESRAAAPAPPSLDALEGLANKLVSAPLVQCDGLLASLDAMGTEAKARTNQALEGRWNETCRLLAKSGIDKIEAVAEARRDLDARRKKALDLIFDEDKYFYPYNPPECPPDKARLYAGVQQEVDALVAAVRDAWKNNHRVSQTNALRAALVDLDWNRAQQKSRKLSFALPAGTPEWLDGLDRNAEGVDLHSFAWDANERAALRRNDLVAARNARVWATKDVAGAVPGFDKDTAAQAVPGKDEQDQVTITNEYRLMMGRVALAWNPRLQAAAQGHTDYMANTGDFGHFEKDPKRRSPGDRVRLVGYTGGAAENCHMGGGGPEGAHLGWIHSSGHHRNILTASHRELASASAGDYWTQNFGAGNEYEKDLVPSRP